MILRSPFHIDPRRHAIALTLGILLFGAGVAQANETVVAVSAAQIDALGVQLQSPRRVAASEAAPWSARVIPAPDAEWIVAAHVGGVVLKVPVSEGQQVTAGTVLAEISSPEVPELAASLYAAESAASLARSEYERDRQLHGEGIIAARRLQVSEQGHARAKAELAAVRMRLALMGLTPQDARDGRLRVRAPADGTVLERRITAGQPLASTDTLFRMADTRRLWVELQVPVASAALFSAGQPLALEGVTATVRAVGSQASDGAQAVSVRAELPANTATLRPGQWVPVRVTDTAVTSTWRIPSTALSREKGDAFVFTQVAQGFTPVKVRVLSSDAQDATVSGALSAEMKVATRGTVALKGAWLGHGGE